MTPAARALAAAAGLTRQRELLIMERRLDDELPGLWYPQAYRSAPLCPDRMSRSGCASTLPHSRIIPSRRLTVMTSRTGWPSPGSTQKVSLSRRSTHHRRLPLDQAAPRSAWGGLRARYRAPAAGRGLGKALLLTGLRSLQQRGSTRVELYVEADHRVAIELYLSYGFAIASRDVMYAQG